MQSEELNENIVETIQEEKPKKKRTIKKTEKVDINTEEIKPEVKTAKVEVRVATDNSIDFYFNGYGIHMLTNRKYKVGDIVEIVYESEIGKKDFAIRLK